MAFVFEYVNEEKEVSYFWQPTSDFSTDMSYGLLKNSQRIWKEVANQVTFVKNRELPFEQYGDVDMEEYLLVKLKAHKI